MLCYSEGYDVAHYIDVFFLCWKDCWPTSDAGRRVMKMTKLKPGKVFFTAGYMLIGFVIVQMYHLDGSVALTHNNFPSRMFHNPKSAID